MGAAPRHRPRPLIARAQFDNLLADQGAPRLGRHRDGSRHATARCCSRRSPTAPWPTAAAASIPSRFPARCQLVVRHLDRRGRRRRDLARHPRRRPPPGPRGARQSPCRRPARPEDQLPARPPAGEVWIGTDRGVARWNGTEITQTGVPAALRATPALSLTRDRDIEPLGRRGRRRAAARRPDGRVHAACRGRVVPRTRDGDLRGPRRQPLGRDRSRHRTLARSRVHDVFESAGPATRCQRSHSCGRGRAGLVRPVERRPVLDPRRPGPPGDGGRAAGRRRLLDPRRRGRGVGRPAARRRHACCASATAASRPSASPSAMGWRRTASSPSIAPATARCGPAR